MQLQHDFVGESEVGLCERRGGRGERCACYDGRQSGVEVETREEDQDIRVRGVDDFCSGNHVRVPRSPIVGIGAEGGVISWVAELVTHADAH